MSKENYDNPASEMTKLEKASLMIAQGIFSGNKDDIFDLTRQSYLVNIPELSIGVAKAILDKANEE